MKVFRLILLFTCSNLCSICFSQRPDSLDNYKEFTSTGRTINGVKVGKWVDLSVDNIIYREGSYDDSGMPIGIWVVNYANGEIRKSTEYWNARVIRWTCYGSKSKVIEVECASGIPDSLYMKVVGLEQQSLQIGFSMTSVKHDDFVTYEESYTVFFPQWFWLVYSLPNLLKKEMFEGMLTMWTTSGKTANIYKYVSGNEAKTTFTYKDDILKFEKEYFNGKLKQVKSFDKEGKLKKELNY